MKEQDKQRQAMDDAALPNPVEVEPFDYTKWRQNLFEGMTGREISAMAMVRRRKSREAEQNDLEH